MDLANQQLLGLELVQNGQTTNGVYYIKALKITNSANLYALDPAYDGGGWMVLANSWRNEIDLFQDFTAYSNHEVLLVNSYIDGKPISLLTNMTGYIFAIKWFGMLQSNQVS